MIDQLKEIVDKAIADVDLQNLKVEEVAKDLVENSRFFAFRILIASRLLEKALLKESAPAEVEDQPKPQEPFL